MKRKKRFKITYRTLIFKITYRTLSTSRCNTPLLREFVLSMFTEGYPGVSGKPLKFYGNDGVCVFKYFTDSSDSQRGFTIGKLTQGRNLCTTVD